MGLTKLHHFSWWVARWLSWTALFTVAGSAFGVLGFLLLTPIFQPANGVPEVILQGVKDGGFYFFVWAPGTSMILCIVERVSGTGPTSHV